VRTRSFTSLVKENFTKQNALENGSWMKCHKHVTEHTHFKKKESFKRLQKILILKELWALQKCRFDSFLRPFLRSGVFLIFERLMDVVNLHGRQC